jgi:hypothetical protein
MSHVLQLILQKQLISRCGINTELSIMICLLSLGQLHTNFSKLELEEILEIR